MFLRQGFFGATRDLLASRGGGPPKVQAMGSIESDPGFEVDILSE